jgi:type IV secretion system protein VirD4
MSESSRGPAAWMDLGQAARRGLFGKNGFLLGDWKPSMLLPVRYKGHSNLITIGPPRSRKGSGVLIPNALQHPFIFVTDFNGEISAVSIKVWREKGYRVIIINPWKMHVGEPWFLPSHSLNVLDGLDPESKTLGSDANLLAGLMITRTGQEHESFFNDAGQSGIKALLMFIAVTERGDGDRHLVKLRRLITGSSDDWKKLIRRMQDCKGDEFIRNKGNEWSRELEVKDNRQFNSVQATMATATAWIDDEVMRETLQHSDVNLGDLRGVEGSAGTVVAVVVPLKYRQTHAAFVRLVISSALQEMEKFPLAKGRVLFMIDEMASLGRVDTIVDALETHPKYKASIHCIFQSIGQIHEIYGPKGADRIMGACDVLQCLGARDLETSGYFSKMAGTTTSMGEDGREFPRPLVFPEEVRQLKGNEQITFIGSGMPIRMGIRPYWERPEFIGKFYPNPFHRDLPGPSIAWLFEALLGAATRVASWVVGPSKPVAVFYAAVVMWGVWQWMT